MTVELRPLGVACNIQCSYCYQHPQRDAGNSSAAYDLPVMKAAIEQEGGPFSLFGGEALLLPLDELEALWSWGLEKHGSNGIQTNGTLITEEHIRLFKTYNVHVGISIDGPGPLNDARWAGTLERTREMTAKSETAIERLCRSQMACSLIITLHRGNAAPDKLPLLHDWFRYLESIGLTSVRLHVLEVDNDAIAQKYRLSLQETIAAFMSFYKLEKQLTRLRFDTFHDMKQMLRGQDNNTTCLWNACDPYTTPAVRGIEGNGQRSNCGRTYKEGIEFVKADAHTFERYLALYHTPQEYGGCAGCRFFLVCKGNCPGMALDGDWRNRTEYCELYKALYRQLEEEMLDAGELPISAHPQRQRIEHALLESWAQQRPMYMCTVLDQLNNPPQSQRTPKALPHHADAPHGDSPHGDSHGDHQDSQ
jgi:uncharacterized protein